LVTDATAVPVRITPPSASNCRASGVQMAVS
jgi:hypothetical protein